MSDERFTLRNRLASFRFALAGLAKLWREEPTTRFHAVGSVAAMGSAWWLEFARWEWAMVVAMIGFVWFAEAINTAVERACDAITLERDPLIGKAKDVASASVLIASLTALGVALIVYTPHVIALLDLA